MSLIVAFYNNFIVKLLKLKNQIIRKKYNIILVIVDKITKCGYFILYIEEILVNDVISIYVKEVFL